MKKILCILLALTVMAVPLFAGGQQEKTTGPVTLTLWTQEGQSENAFQFVEKLANEYAASTNIVAAIEVLNKETEALREDFQTASLAGTSPDLLWTVNDHAGPFVTAGLIQPVENLVDMNDYVESVIMDGHTWGVPISSGNHLMLLYNKKYITTPPATTDELIAMAQANTKGDMYGLAFNLGEAFWLAPWLGGFGGRVFADDGVTPSLNTPEMVATLDFMQSLTYDYKVTPLEADYAVADTLFKEGKAAMIINGDWSLGGYADVLGDDFGAAPLPKVVATGLYPAPYTSGKYFMIPEDLAPEKVEAVVGFIKFVTSKAKQYEQLEVLNRLPALKAAMDHPDIENDPVLAGSIAQLAKGTPMPSVLEMRAIWDAINPEQSAVMAGTLSPAEAAANMQAAAVTGIENLQ